jgi:ABC-type iron transport system FetAB ATPase subunit
MFGEDILILKSLTSQMDDKKNEILMDAARRGKKEVAMALVKVKADVNHTDKVIRIYSEIAIIS